MSGTSPIGVIAQYNLLEQLEPAGPGELYRARDTHHGRTVAVRWLPADAVHRGLDTRALLAVAQSLTTISHPNVITLFDAGMHDGRLFIAFEYVRGRSLRDEMGGLPMVVRTAVELAVQVASAVSEAHAAGYVHGGLSPESVLITAKGRAKIPVFELATTGGFETTAGATHLHDYPAPEESEGVAADERSDVYSVGAILYEMLTGRRPSPRGAAAPGAANSRVAPELDAVVLRAVAPRPERRIETVARLETELRSVLARLDAAELAGGPAPRAQQRPAASRAARLALAAVAAAAGAIAWWLLR